MDILLIISGALLLFSLAYLTFFTKLILTRINLSRDNAHRKFATGWAIFALVISIVLMMGGIALLSLTPYLIL